uniref:Uncharacterized protein n=1 Tax=Oryzias latipes TaxID=8090 RepID=A0A3B3HV06_ORYLA
MKRRRRARATPVRHSPERRWSSRNPPYPEPAGKRAGLGEKPRRLPPPNFPGSPLNPQQQPPWNAGVVPRPANAGRGTTPAFPAREDAHQQEPVAPQTPRNGISPVCMRAWRCSVLPWLKLFPQASQEKSFSPVCVRMWMVRWLLLLKRLPQVWQGKGLSPVCVRVCRSSVLLWLKHLPQTWQEPLLWQKRLPHTLQTSFPQILQEKGFSPVWIMMWFLNTEDCEKLFPQVLHR